MLKSLILIFHLFALQACSVSSSVSDSWQEIIKSSQIPQQHAVLELNWRLPVEDWSALRKGLIPKNQDDRWLIVYQNNSLRFYRSTTGYLIYQCSIKKNSESIYISSCLTNRNPSQISLSLEEQMDTDDKNRIAELLTYILGHKPEYN